MSAVAIPSVTSPALGGLDQILFEICEELQLPPHRHDQAESRYKAVAGVLEAEQSPFRSFLIEAVHGVNQSDHAGTGQIVECDARRYPALEASRDSVHQIEVLKDCSVSGCAVVRNAFGVVAEFHFRSFSARLVRGNKQRADLLPKTPRAEGDHPLAAIGERSAAEGCTKRNEVQ
jgi:hypothetical protein